MNRASHFLSCKSASFWLFQFFFSFFQVMYLFLCRALGALLAAIVGICQVVVIFATLPLTIIFEWLNCAVALAVILQDWKWQRWGRRSTWSEESSEHPSPPSSASSSAPRAMRSVQRSVAVHLEEGTAREI